MSPSTNTYCTTPVKPAVVGKCPSAQKMLGKVHKVVYYPVTQPWMKAWIGKIDHNDWSTFSSQKKSKTFYFSFFYILAKTKI